MQISQPDHFVDSHTAALYEEEVNVGSRTVLAPYRINYCQAIGNYTLLFLENKQQLMVSTTLGIIEDRMADSGMFVRANRSFLVNTQYIKEYDEDSILLKNKCKIELPRRKKHLVYSTLNSLLN